MPGYTQVLLPLPIPSCPLLLNLLFSFSGHSHLSHLLCFQDGFSSVVEKYQSPIILLFRTTTALEKLIPF